MSRTIAAKKNNKSRVILGHWEFLIWYSEPDFKADPYLFKSISTPPRHLRGSHDRRKVNRSLGSANERLRIHLARDQTTNRKRTHPKSWRLIRGSMMYHSMQMDWKIFFRSSDKLSSGQKMSWLKYISANAAHFEKG